MDTTVKLRPSSRNDLASILAIYNHAIKHTTAVYSYEPYTKKEIEDWYNAKQEKGEPIIIADQGGAVAGFVTFGAFRMRPAYQYTVEHSIYVHPDYRRQGIAGLLMHRIIEEAEKAQKHTLIGGIDAENEVSITFHEKFGFVEVAHIKEVGYKFDRWLDLKFMQLTLKTPTNI